jgi:hypothetical protein
LEEIDHGLAHATRVKSAVLAVASIVSIVSSIFLLW